MTRKQDDTSRQAAFADRYPELALALTAYIERTLEGPPDDWDDRDGSCGAPLPDRDSSVLAGVAVGLGFGLGIGKSGKGRALRKGRSEPSAPPPEALPGEFFREDYAEELRKAVMAQDESFSGMLMRKIEERGISAAQCYRKGNVDRKLFSKIKKDPNYRPAKETALAFAIALEMDMDETRELLQKAGYSLSHSRRFDIIVEFFIARGEYNIYVINEALFAYDQPLLGNVGNDGRA